VHFLGLRPQAEVPAYLAHADVCLIPFKLDPPTRGSARWGSTSTWPWASGGRLRSAELSDLPYVTIARGEAQFVDAVPRAQSVKPAVEDLARFAAENGWKMRVRQLERLLGV
jgi:hypothetical protein